MNKLLHPLIITLVLQLFATVTVVAQTPHNNALFVTMQQHDSIFFERGFNLCDTAFLNEAVHKDLIFYHDKAGVQNKKQFISNVIKNLCSNPAKKPVRKVRKETLEVYPLYNNDTLYGVVQTGVHDFYIRTPNTADAYTGTAKFTHVYLWQQGKWLLKEVLSFDHK